MISARHLNSICIQSTSENRLTQSTSGLQGSNLPILCISKAEIFYLPHSPPPILQLQPKQGLNSSIVFYGNVSPVHHSDINLGVYKAGFAKKQEPYDKAVRELFAALDRVEGILSSQRYLTGSQITLADIRLYTTLARFDCVYVGHFKVWWSGSLTQ